MPLEVQRFELWDICFARKSGLMKPMQLQARVVTSAEETNAFFVSCFFSKQETNAHECNEI
jgi:hypothetical protein